jgi:UDP-N-acetylglucosamine 2-epimerase (hydrolysing)
MKNAAVMVGNSSAGVREAPFLGIPSLDVGTRQNNRASGESITACSANERAVIDEFISTKWGHQLHADKAFGAGDSAERFVQKIRSSNYWEKSLQKLFTS